MISEYLTFEHDVTTVGRGTCGWVLGVWYFAEEFVSYLGSRLLDLHTKILESAGYSRKSSSNWYGSSIRLKT